MPPSAQPPLLRRRSTYLVGAGALLLAVTCTLAGNVDNVAYGAGDTAAAITAGEAPPDDWWGDTSDIPPAQNVLTVKVLNRTNGEYPDDQVFWTFNGETHSIAEQPYVDMPANSAGRMTFHLGSPDSQYTDFIEFTVGDNVFNGNTTRVDGFGLKLAMRLHSKDGSDLQVGEDHETFQESRDATWQKFADAVPDEFSSLTEVEKPNRIPSPANAPDFQDGGAHADYLSGYAKEVGIDATTNQIFGCSGPLANEAGTCSALNRHVAHLSEDQWSSPENYYKEGPANYYAKFWHDHSINSLAYGFPYDDFAGQSSFISHEDPEWLQVAVGW